MCHPRSRYLVPTERGPLASQHPCWLIYIISRSALPVFPSASIVPFPKSRTPYSFQKNNNPSISQHSLPYLRATQLHLGLHTSLRLPSLSWCRVVPHVVFRHRHWPPPLTCLVRQLSCTSHSACRIYLRQPNGHLGHIPISVAYLYTPAELRESTLALHRTRNLHIALPCCSADTGSPVQLPFFESYVCNQPLFPPEPPKPVLLY